MRLLSVLSVLAVLALGASAFYEGKTAVTELTPENFEEKVLKSDGVWIVEFYAPWCGHCKHLAPEWKKAAAALKGSVHLGAVDADKHGSLGSKYNVEGFPTIKVFGADKSKPEDYDGGRTADAIVKAALQAAKKVSNGRLGVTGDSDDGAKQQQKQQQQQQQQGAGFYDNTDVVQLTDESFEKEVLNPEGKGGWLVEFYAPWCGHCKSLAPEWKKAATALSGAIKIAAVDATIHQEVARKYNVQGYPTIKFFPPGGEAPEEYNAGRTADAIIDYGNKMAEKYPASAPEVNQIKDTSALKALSEAKTMAVVFVVPHVLDTGAAGRNKLIESFVSIAGKLRSRGVSFGWIVGGDHSKFEEGFGVYSTYPTFIAFNPKNLRYAVHRGTFSEDALLDSLKKILNGKTGLTQLSALPSLSSGVELWDGKDYVAPEEDEL
jgi:protein disulfide-isomerase A6